MSNIVQQAEQGGYRARADRSIQSGRVVTANRTTNTATLDVGMIDNDGNPVYMVDVPFTPQNPPQKQDLVPILRTNSSPYSFVIGAGAAVGGANTGQIVQAGGAVTSIKKTGETAGQQGDLILDPGSNVTITRTGKTFTIAAAASALTPATTVTDVAASGAVGSSVNYAREDHAHKGVHSIAKHAGTALFGDVTLAEGTNVTLGVSANEITINAASGGSGVSCEVSGGVETAAADILNFIPGTNIDSITVANNTTDIDITINAKTQAGSGGDSEIGGVQSPGVATVYVGRLFVVIYTGATGTGHTYSLPAINGGTNKAFAYLIVNADDHDLTVDAGGPNTIEGQATLTLQPGQRTILVAMENGEDTWRQFHYTPEVPVNVQSGTTYTLVRSDAGKCVEITNASATTVTIPPNSSVPFPNGTIVRVMQGGAVLKTTIAAGSGVTLRSNGSKFNTNGQYSHIELRKSSAVDTWYMTGDTS